jgi:sulfite exporter TauE/SafE
MLSSIHPLGERARRNKWLLTVTTFTVGATITGAIIGLGLGWIGSLVAGSIGEEAGLGLTAGVVLLAGALDLARVAPLGPQRQVNESWIGHYRGWVYGFAFGSELGAGLATFVVTWLVYSTLAAEVLTGSPWLGAMVGVTFGLGRSLSLWAAGWIDRPSRLTRFHEKMASLGLPLHRVTAIGMTVIGVAAGIGALT